MTVYVYYAVPVNYTCVPVPQHSVQLHSAYHLMPLLTRLPDYGCRRFWLHGRYSRLLDAVRRLAVRTAWLCTLLVLTPRKTHHHRSHRFCAYLRSIACRNGFTGAFLVTYRTTTGSSTHLRYRFVHHDCLAARTACMPVLDSVACYAHTPWLDLLPSFHAV